MQDIQTNQKFLELTMSDQQRQLSCYQTEQDKAVLTAFFCKKEKKISTTENIIEQDKLQQITQHEANGSMEPSALHSKHIIPGGWEVWGGRRSCLWLSSCMIAEQHHKARLPKARLEAKICAGSCSVLEPS